MKALLVFFLIGGLLFLIDNQREVGTIVVDATLRERIAGLWDTQMGRRPADAELESLVENWVVEELLYREALKLGLDANDTIIRRRLVQKLSFLMQDASSTPGSDEELETFYREHIEDYTRPDTFSFQQIFIQDPSSAETVRGKLAAGVDWRELGDPTLLPASINARTHREIIADLGQPISPYLDRLVQGEWVGPLPSSFGYHLINLQRLEPSAPVPLADVRRQVEADWLRRKQETAMDEYQQSLREQYEVIYQ